LKFTAASRGSPCDSMAYLFCFGMDILPVIQNFNLFYRDTIEIKPILCHIGYLFFCKNLFFAVELQLAVVSLLAINWLYRPIAYLTLTQTAIVCLYPGISVLALHNVLQRPDC